MFQFQFGWKSQKINNVYRRRYHHDYNLNTQTSDPCHVHRVPNCPDNCHSDSCHHDHFHHDHCHRSHPVVHAGDRIHLVAPADDHNRLVVIDDCCIPPVTFDTVLRHYRNPVDCNPDQLQINIEYQFIESTK